MKCDEEASKTYLLQSFILLSAVEELVVSNAASAVLGISLVYCYKGVQGILRGTLVGISAA